MATIVATIFSFAAAIIIMFKVDPFEAGLLAKALFFISIFLGMSGLIKIIIFKKHGHQN